MRLVPIPGSSRRGHWAPACALVALLLAAPALALQTAMGPVYPVSSFEIEYALDHPRHIPVQELLEIEVGLSSLGLAYTAPRPVDRTVRMRLSSLPEGASFSATAIQHIAQYIVSTFNRRGFNGVIVSVPDIDELTGADLRPPGRTRLRLRVWTGRVSRVATVADGERFEGLSTEQRTNLTAHRWIRERSPVQPGGVRGLLDVGALEDYAAALSRHPGRRVDVELAPGPRTGTSDVNLRVAENKPWLVYAQYSNTGTPDTTKNRERFGFVDNQTTGRDDILSLDYVTGDFEDVHSAVGSYTSPFVLGDPLRFKLTALYSQFDSSEVGFVDARFHGEQAFGEGQLLYTLLQRRELFVDGFVGARYHQMSADNQQFASLGGLDQQQTARFIVPQLGVVAERVTRTSQLNVRAELELGFTDEDELDLEVQGTPRPDTSFALLDWDAGYSFYLEPLLDRQAWEDPGTPATSTLAHEIAVSFRGQWAFDNRLVPQYQQVAGGFYTVRGYKQAQIARDNMLLGSLEYRLHVPRLFPPDPVPLHVPWLGDFHVHPASVFGTPDWDLVMRLFGDAAHGTASDPSDLEDEAAETLLSLGGGLELQLGRNLNVRLDAGHVLRTVGGSEAGDTRANVLATLLY